MKVSVLPVDDPAAGVVLGGRGMARRTGWWLQEEPLAGWHESVAQRADAVPVPQGDGAYWPAQLLSEHRVVTVRGIALSSSSVEGAAARARINGLVGRRLDVCVEDAGGPMWAQGYISAPSQVRFWWREREALFSLIITCPDPHKYGSPVDVPAVGGMVAFDNAGNAPTWPTFIVGGPVSAFSASLGGQVISWQGSAPSGVVIDTYEGTATTPTGATTGVLVDDDVFQLPPGRSTLTVATTPSVPVTLRARAAWR